MIEAVTPSMIRDWVKRCQLAHSEIEHREWDSQNVRHKMSPSEMWSEATQIVPQEWREIVRVLAQGGDYYFINW